MYRESDVTDSTVSVIHMVTKLNSLLGGYFSEIMPHGGARPLGLDTVARATVAATLNKGIQGIIDVEKIVQLDS
jgi:hypothetical protein